MYFVGIDTRVLSIYDTVCVRISLHMCMCAVLCGCIEEQYLSVHN